LTFEDAALVFAALAPEPEAPGAALAAEAPTDELASAESESFLLLAMTRALPMIATISTAPTARMMLRALFDDLFDDGDGPAGG
jgi:hypothetical protein